MVNDDFHVDIRLDVSVLPQYGHPSVLLYLPLLSYRLVELLSLSLPDLGGVADIE